MNDDDNNVVHVVVIVVVDLFAGDGQHNQQKFNLPRLRLGFYYYHVYGLIHLLYTTITTRACESHPYNI